MTTTVLGISAYYHDSAAAIVRDGELVAAAQEERFTRVKHDPSFPRHAIEWCLSAAEVDRTGLDAVAFYDKPLTKLVRILKTFVQVGPSGARPFPRAMKEWSTRKLWVAHDVEACLDELHVDTPGDPLYAEHHVSHAAAAFYPSPFDEACVLTLDGVGEWATSSIGVGRGHRLELLEELRFPHSLGLLYSAFTYQAGFKVNSGEYKLMGLAPYGRPVLRDRILDELVDLRDDGSFTLRTEHFGFLDGERMTNGSFDALFGGRPPRDPDAPITQLDCDLAASVQDVLEEIVLRVARHAHELTGTRDVVMAGGVALNCVANARLLREGPFDRVWVQPAAGDAGSAAGCAWWATHEVLGSRRRPARPDGMSGALLGPRSDPDDVAGRFQDLGRPFVRLSDPDERADRVAELLADGRVVAVYQGRAEFGPRALGNRSILADPRSPGIQSELNLKVKQRESFRPFAPAVLAEHAAHWFDTDAASPYMTFVAPVRDFEAGPASESHPGAHDDPDLGGRLAAITSPLPGVTHVDGSARLQTVTADDAPGLHRILTSFHRRTGCPVLINTSFNVRGEPIVGDPEDAYRCFMTTDIDWLLVEDCLFDKSEQAPWTRPTPTYEPD